MSVIVAKNSMCVLKNVAVLLLEDHCQNSFIMFVHKIHNS